MKPRETRTYRVQYLADKEYEMKILLLNGANMNMLGKRKAEFYGTDTLGELENKAVLYGKQRGADVVCMQSNCEGKLIDVLQQTDCDGVVFNAGAYSHYSYALRDCIECVSVPVVEVHLSDIYSREDFRKTDVLRDVCKAAFFGEGINGYYKAIDFLVKQ